MQNAEYRMQKAERRKQKEETGKKKEERRKKKEERGKKKEKRRKKKEERRKKKEEFQSESLPFDFLPFHFLLFLSPKSDPHATTIELANTYLGIPCTPCFRYAKNNTIRGRLLNLRIAAEVSGRSGKRCGFALKYKSIYK